MVIIIIIIILMIYVSRHMQHINQKTGQIIREIQGQARYVNKLRVQSGYSFLKGSFHLLHPTSA